MQQLSYDPHDPWFDVYGWEIAAQVITFENIYGLDSEASTVARQGDHTVIACSQLTWAGGQERCEGSARIEVTRTGDGIEIVVSAQHTEKIRCVKLLVRGLAPGEIIGAFWGRSPIRGAGAVLSYPTPLHTPLVFLAQAGSEQAYFQSLDDRVRAKRFAFYERDGAVVAELIFEELAPQMSPSVTAPTWRIGRTGDPGAIAEAHRLHIERSYNLQPWESRTMRHVSRYPVVVSGIGQHR